ncbi:MAG: VanZ family protein [Phycisphaerae bacterium]
MPPRSGHRRALWSLILLVGYWVLLFAATHMPLGDEAGLPWSGADKIIHMVLYCVLAVLGIRYLRALGPGCTRVKLLGWAGVCITYAGVDEWLQRFVGRTPSFWDWSADVAGVAAATLMHVVMKPPPRPDL